LPYATAAVVLAALMFLVPPGLLKGAEAKQADQQLEQLDATHVAVKRQLDALRETMEATPALEELKAELTLVDPKAGGIVRQPEDIRHEAAKKIDSLSDLVKEKQERAEYAAVKEMQKMLRGLKPPGPTESPTQKLSEALAEGDFKSAQEEIKAIKEQLATLKSEQDKELVDKLSKQLEELSKQIEQLAKDEKLAEKLQQAGIDPETAERILESLTKKDLEQIKKMLEEKGLSQEKIEKLVRQMQQNQQAGAMAKQLAQAMKNAGQAGASGQAGDAMQGLQAAADQLGELEQLQQEIAQLEAAAAALGNAQSAIDKPCAQCQGTGHRAGKPCSACQGRGGMGQRGQGRGGLAPEEQTAMQFKVERGKVHTQKGAIIGQFLVEGEQVKGDVSKSFAEVVTASEREASDRINRDRIPRHYHKAIKEYFSQVRKAAPSIGPGVAPESGPASATDAQAEEAESGDSPNEDRH
jgi:DNA polymerase III alpha subunit (gram-positive type)